MPKDSFINEDMAMPIARPYNAVWVFNKLDKLIVQEITNARLEAVDFASGIDVRWYYPQSHTDVVGTKGCISIFREQDTSYFKVEVSWLDGKGKVVNSTVYTVTSYFPKESWDAMINDVRELLKHIRKQVYS